MTSPDQNQISPVPEQEAPDFKKELTALLNKHSMENASNTPDYVLAEYLVSCLNNWNLTMARRELWYMKHDLKGGLLS